MKAERRHELKSNSLARTIETLPEQWRVHGNKAVLVLIGILLIIIVIRYRLSESAQREATAKSALTAAELQIAELRHTPYWRYPPEAIGTVRNQQAGDAEETINEALKNSDDDNLRARAYVDRGDLNFLLGNFPAIPATTQPGAAPMRTSDEYLNAAKAAYEEVLKTPLSRNRQAVSSAWLGLAAVAENESKWDVAHSNYDAVINDNDAPRAIKDYAKQRMDQLADLQKRPFIGTASTAPVSPLLGPTSPLTSPASAPASGPAATSPPASAGPPLPSPTGSATAPASAPATAAP